MAMVGEVFGISFLIPAAQCEFEMGSSEKGLLNAVGYIGEREFRICNGQMIIIFVFISYCSDVTVGLFELRYAH
jgi:hypothetical protein